MRKLSNKQRALASVVFTLLVLVGTFAFSSEHDGPSANCAIERPQRTTMIAGGAVSLLARAHAAKGASAEWSGNAKNLLEQCVTWEAARGFSPPAAEVRAQLECYGLIENTDPNVGQAHALRLVESSKALITSVQDVGEVCEVLHQKLRSTRRADHASTDPTKALVALGGLAGFEKKAHEAFASIKLAGDFLEHRVEAGDWDAEDVMHDIHPVRIGLRSCLLKAVQEARTIANALPINTGSVNSVQRCKPHLLKGVEKLAFAEAELEADGSVIFSAGMLMSEISMTVGGTPFFGRSRENSSWWNSLTRTTSSDAVSPWAEDAKGMEVPGDIVKAETMLMQGFQATVGPEQTERAALRAIRLSMHAKFLMEKELDEAAEWRYRAAAALAARYGRDKLASHSLAQLSYFFALRGHEEEALKVADKAVHLGGSDPLATYMQATLRISLFELRNDEQVRATADQLMTVEGKLPTKILENMRAATSANLETWRQVTDSGSFSSCLLGDAAQILICVFANAAYMM